MISKNLLQKTKNQIPRYVLKQMRSYLSDDWNHIVFTGDSKAIQYLEENKTSEYTNIVDKFYSFRGAHRADLFRIFWLWQNGGMYLDSDIMLNVKIDKIIKTNSQFITTVTPEHKECSISVLGSTAYHPIMSSMLDLMYNLDPKILEHDYFYVCKQLYQQLINSNLPGIRVYIEVTDDCKGITEIKGNETIAYHYYKYKIIPDKN